MKECLTNGGNKLTGNHPTSDTMLHIEVRLPVLLCAVKTVKGDFRCCWTSSPNVGQTHKENPNLVRIFYMICTLNDIYKQYNKFTRTLIHKKSLHFAVSRTETRPKMHPTCIWNTGNMQSIVGPVHASAVWTDKKNNTNCSYRIFIVCRSPVSTVFWARILLSYFGLSLPKQSLCTNFPITR